jgi:hypothetical protein
MNYKEISKDQCNNLVNNYNTEYIVKEGDRIYIADACKVKKRDVDKYLKAEYLDVKRVSKLEDCNVVFDERKSLFKTGDLFLFKIDGELKAHKHTWDVDKEAFHKECAKIIPAANLSEYFTYKNWNGNDCLRFNDNCINKFKKNYPELYSKKYGMLLSKNDLNYDTILADLDNIPIYNSDKFIVKVTDYLNAEVRESTEDIDFESIEQLLRSNDSSNVNLAITMMSSFDMTRFYPELTCVYFSCYHQRLLRKYLTKSYLFREINLPNVSSRDSNIEDRGLSYFREIIKHLKKNNIEINYNYILKFLLDE